MIRLSNILKPEPSPFQNREAREQKQFNWNRIEKEFMYLGNAFGIEKSKIDQFLNDMFERYNAVITATTKDGEIKASRIDIDGNSHVSLEERLIADFNKLTDITSTGNFDTVDNFVNNNQIDVGGPFPDYYKANMETVTTLPTGNNIVNIGHITDDHHQLSSYAPNSLSHYSFIAAASRLVKLDAVIAGGDNTNGWYGKQQKITETKQATSTLFNRVEINTPVFFNVGNHDNGRWQNGNNTPVNCLSDNELKEFYRTGQSNYGEVRDDDSFYYYLDLKEKKVRIIGLNSFDLPETLNDDGSYKYKTITQSAYRQRQLNWLANVALKLPENDWQVIIFTHCPLPGTFEVQVGQAPLSQINSDVLIGIINAYQNGTKFELVDEEREMPINIDVDYSNQGESILIALVSGHIHADSNMIYKGINCIETAASLCYSEDVHRTPNSASEDLWDIFSIDTETKDIHIHRFGYGEDRIIKY